MKLTRLLSAQMYRDGGSLEATFLDASGDERSLFLKRSRMPDDLGFHHKNLYPCSYRSDGNMPQPILKGSFQEQSWLDALAAWIAENIEDEKLIALRAPGTLTGNWTEYDMQLHKVLLLFEHIPKRE